MAGFVITRFTHGSGGKFLSSVIQTSDTVDHWSTVLQNFKHDKIFPQLVEHYFDRSFPLDHSQALRNEPACPYRTDLYSSTYPRGNDVTIEQLLSHANEMQDSRFLDSWHSSRLVNLNFMKPELPRFCDNNLVVTITIESEAEQHWVHQSLWNKHWIDLGSEIVYAPNDPSYCHLTTLPQVLKFKNRSRYLETEKNLVWNEFVIQNHTRHWYVNSDRFKSYDESHKLHNFFIALRSFFDRDQFIHCIENLVKKFDLNPIDTDLIDLMRSCWVQRQIPFDD